MTVPAQITDHTIREHINRAVLDVFTTMVSRRPTLCEQVGRCPGKALAPTGFNREQIAGTVGFVGEISGQIFLHFDLEFARICTCHLLGMTEPELREAGDDVINDAIGELTNMTVGSFKNGLSDAGYPCMLTIPSILRGSHFSVEPITSVVRHIFHFECAEHRVVADIMMRDES